ncbi:MAG: lamin tail domain-containing protein, partial [Lacibacter sp.]
MRKFSPLFILVFLFHALSGLSQIVINEAYIRPDGGVATPPNGLIYSNSKEYIELYNAGCAPVNVAGYFLAMKQELTNVATGGTIRIPNVPAATIAPGGHLVLGSGVPGGIVAGNIDIPITGADRCLYNGNMVLANADGWLALYDASGTPLDCIYWSGSQGNITANQTDFNPSGGICLPAGSPAVTLQTATQIYQSKPCIVSYVGNSSPVIVYRTSDGAPTWGFAASFNAGTLPSTINKSVAGGNCNGGTCKVIPPVQAPPTIGTVTNAASCGSTGSVVLNNLPGNLNNGQAPCSNWTVTRNPGGVTTTGNTTSTTISNLPPGTYTFTVTNLGGCTSVASNQVTITGPTNCCTVGAASGTPEVCQNQNTNINITHATNGATGLGTITNLPAGLTPSYSNNTITISGVTTAAPATYNYTIQVTGS